MPQPGKGSAPGCAAQDDVDPIACALQRRPVVRRAQKDPFAQLAWPLQSGLHCLLEGTARDQTAHAVDQHAQLLHRHRPVGQQGFDAAGQLLAVHGGVQPRVIAHIDWRVAQCLRQVRAMVMACAQPLQIIHAQAMQQQQHLAAGLA